MKEDYLKEYYEQLEKEKARFEGALNIYKENCIIPFEETEDLEIMEFYGGDFYHIGYCTVIESAYKHPSKKNAEYFEIKDVEGEVPDGIRHLIFEKQDESENFHVLIWQTAGRLEDDYSGYVLYPMKDGRYWIVKYDI